MFKMKLITEQAKSKGLKVQVNQLSPGYCVTMPSGAVYTASTLRDLQAFVVGF